MCDEICLQSGLQCGWVRVLPLCSFVKNRFFLFFGNLRFEHIIATWLLLLVVHQTWHFIAKWCFDSKLYNRGDYWGFMLQPDAPLSLSAPADLIPLTYAEPQLPKWRPRLLVYLALTAPPPSFIPASRRSHQIWDPTMHWAEKGSAVEVNHSKCKSCSDPHCGNNLASGFDPKKDELNVPFARRIHYSSGSLLFLVTCGR